jgi:nucleotide-binding universal stress UspA family protein
MAIQDFQAARQRAAVQEVLARFTGKSSRLLSYDDVAEKLKLRVRAERGVQQIPLDAIVGSVGRYTDFTRSFLPREMKDQQRWARVKAAMEEGAGLPPIEVYKVGEAYFVVDGNHRVSIARELGSTTIAAHVMEFETPIQLMPDVQPDELIIQAEYAGFLDATHLHEMRPNVDLRVTSCCQYDGLLDEVRATQYLLEQQGQQVSLPDAAASWYDTTYIPVAETIRDRGLLRWFPGRTVTDLYIWISQNRAALEEELGWDIRSGAAAADLILERGARTEAGSWRRARTVSRYTDHLFVDILVPFSGDAQSWDALEQAIIIAGREGAKLHGLHIVRSADAVASPATLALQEQFEKRCAGAGVAGTLVTERGDITRKISERAAMADLIVLKVAHPPVGRLAALRSSLRKIIAGSSCPMLAVPGKPAAPLRALLAYDGSELAKEALFVAAYLAEIWKVSLSVFTALDGTKVTSDVQDYVRRYLDIHEVTADYIVSEQGSTGFLKRTVEERGADLVLMGSHSGSLLQHVLIGSTLDTMLRESRVPIFICH